MMKSCGVCSIYPDLGFGGQEYLCHDFFSLDSTAKLPKRIGINNHPIEITFQVVRRCSNIVYL